MYPAKVEGRLREGIDEYRAEWKPMAGIAAWQSYLKMSKEGFESRNAEFTAQGYSVESQSNFVDSAGNVQYLATWTRKF